jgi:putative DNA primase/helicase
VADIHQLFDGMIATGHSNDQNGSPARPANYSDEALANRFTARHRDDLRFVNTWGRWLVWDGKRWQPDETLIVTDHARGLVREASSEVLEGNGSQKLAAVVASARTVSAIERLARADRQHASQTRDWDRDPWLLNTPTGTIDLKTGQVRPHHRQDLITKMTTVGPGEACPKWLKFLNRIFEGDQNLIAYIQRVLGYSLTGSVQEHALFFCYGTGGNGKGVLLGTWHGILGDYSAIAPMSTFTATQNERHPTELAMLRGARLVTAQETEDGHHWAESKIKALTGGDPVSARFMRQDFFTYQPSFKLIVAGNHRPSLRNVDEAIRRRFNLVPFTITIPLAERDPDLAEKLKEEWPGILAWAIEGCLEWQRIGLVPPSAVTEATENYLTEEDAVGRFISECCERHPQALAELKKLYANWKRFCETSGEQILSEKSFSQKLESQQNLIKGQDSRSRRVIFRGIRLRPNYDEPEAWVSPPDAAALRGSRDA